MLYRSISRVVGYYLYIFAITLCLPLCVAGYAEFIAPEGHPQPHSTAAFAQTVIICALLGGLLHWIGRHQSRNMYKREALAVVILIWFISSGIGALPFTLSHTLEPVDAFFEVMSGYTTTGGSLMEGKAYDSITGEEIKIRLEVAGPVPTVYEYYGTISPVRDPATGAILYEGIEAVGMGLLFWRALCCWLGGGGIVVLLVAILPALGVGGKVLYEAETSGNTGSGGLTPRIKETAGWIWKFYVGFTLLQILLLMATNDQMTLFDATTTAFTTLATAGYCIRNANIAHYNSASTEWIVIAFMLIGSINFTLYYYCWQKKIHRLYRDRELMVYLASIITFSLIVIWSIYGTTTTSLRGESITLSFGEAVRCGLFQLLSSHSTTGFATVDFDTFPYVAQTAILIVMYIGGMTTSTAGGIKIIRYYVLCRFAIEKVELLFRPNRVRALRIGNQNMTTSLLTKVFVLFFIAVSFAILGTLLLVMDGVDPESALTTIACMANNIGFAFRAGGPASSFAFLSPFGKILCSVWMLLGRLEYFALLILLLPSFWQKK